MNTPQKYGLLWTIAWLLKALAWVALVVGIVGTIVALVSLGGTGDPLLRGGWTAGAILLPLIGISWFIQLYAIGGVLSLLIEIEQNTRALAARGTEQ